MYNNIPQFNEKCSEKLEKIVNLILNCEANFNVLTEVVQEEVLELGTNIVKEVIEKTDKLIKESVERKKNYTQERKNETKQILDVMGIITYSRTGCVIKSISVIRNIRGKEAQKKFLRFKND